jgi:hypothetical protein
MGYEPIGRIRPVAPAPSLLTAMRPLPEGVNWSTGISWSTGCQPSYNWSRCPDLDTLVLRMQEGGIHAEITVIDGQRFKAVPADRNVVHSMPFTIYTPYLCTDAGTMGERAIGDAESFVTDLTEAHTAAQIAAALWMGDGYADDDLLQPTLRRSAELAHDDVLDLDDGIAALLLQYQLCTGGNGGAIIHMPGALLTGALGGGGGGARICWPEGQTYRGPHGCLVVAGPGYPEGSSLDGPGGHGPILDPDLPNTYMGNDADTSWVYVTGPVEFAVTDVKPFPEDPADRFVQRQNYHGLFGEREAIVRFDPCCVFAVEVTNPVPLPEVS